MNSVKPCRNCGEKASYYRDVAASGTHGPNLLPIGSIFFLPTFVIRVCGGCGIVDFFVPDDELPKVREKFTPNVEIRRNGENA
jgi:hypothetical protein